MMQWLEELNGALEREFSSKPKIGTLATVDRSGAPHARSVVLRRIDEEGRLYIATDARTEKNNQLRGNKRAELLFWLRDSRVQFRVSGETSIVAFPEDEPLRKDVWRQLSDEARALFFWPTPGIAAATDDAFALAVSADVAPPRTFEILIVIPRHVDRLSTETVPHRRRIWRIDTNWSGVDVNP